MKKKILVIKNKNKRRPKNKLLKTKLLMDSNKLKKRNII